QGARLVLVGRDPARGEAALARIKARAPRAEVSMHYADLSRLDALRTLAAGLNGLSRIDVLINNAGAMFWRRQVTADGLERTFALNHMAYFVLTALLRDKLVASCPARIVNVASDAHPAARLGTRIAKQLLAISPERGAETPVYLASSPAVEGKSGGYYDQCAPKTPSPEAQDAAAARRLWEESARIAGVSP